MSCSRRCDYFKAKDGQWYMTLGNFEHAHDDHECTNYGPFPSEAAATQYRRDNFSNPGGACIDDSGTSEVPADVEAPRRSSYTMSRSRGPFF